MVLCHSFCLFSSDPIWAQASSTLLLALATGLLLESQEGQRRHPLLSCYVTNAGKLTITDK